MQAWINTIDISSHSKALPGECAGFIAPEEGTEAPTLCQGGCPGTGALVQPSVANVSKGTNAAFRGVQDTEQNACQLRNEKSQLSFRLLLVPMDLCKKTPPRTHRKSQTYLLMLSVFAAAPQP